MENTADRIGIRGFYQHEEGTPFFVFDFLAKNLEGFCSVIKPGDNVSCILEEDLGSDEEEGFFPVVSYFKEPFTLKFEDKEKVLENFFAIHEKGIGFLLYKVPADGMITEGFIIKELWPIVFHYVRHFVNADWSTDRLIPLEVIDDVMPYAPYMFTPLAPEELEDEECDEIDVQIGIDCLIINRQTQLHEEDCLVISHLATATLIFDFAQSGGKNFSLKEIMAMLLMDNEILKEHPFFVDEKLGELERLLEEQLQKV